MTRKAYVGNASIARNVKSIYVGVDGTARRVVKGYVGNDDGIARQFWPPEEPPVYPPDYPYTYGDSQDSINTNDILSDQRQEAELSRARLSNPLNDVKLSDIT
jgi:hypothetical protein